MSKNIIVNKQELLKLFQNELRYSMNGIGNFDFFINALEKVLNKHSDEYIDVDSKLKIVDFIGIENLHLRLSLDKNIDNYNRGYYQALADIIKSYKFKNDEKEK